MTDFEKRLLLIALVSAGGIAAAIGGYFLLKRLFPPEVEFAGVRVPITDEDKLWMARMIVGEVGENPSQDAAAAVLWSTLTRWRTLPAFQDMTYTQLMRAFSQPINPIWASRGTPEQIAHRAEITSMPWSTVPPAIRAMVDAFAQGRVTNPVPGYNNFAASGAIGSGALTQSELPPVDVGGNVYVRDQGSLPGEVRIV